MKFIPAQKLTPSYYELLESRINDLLWELVYRPIVKHVASALPKGTMPTSPQSLANAVGTALRAALKSGAVQMIVDKKGLAVFSLTGGKSSRGIADDFRSFGAKLDNRTRSYSCPQSSVPGWVRQESAEFRAKSKAVHDQVKKTLRDAEQKIEKAIDEFDLAQGADHAVAESARGWKECAEDHEVGVPELSAVGQRELAAGFAKNAKIPIKEWAKETISRLREQVEENASQGYRAEGLAERIRTEYGVSASRANLIAIQETSNFMSAFRAGRAIAAGCPTYRWSCTRDNRVRAAHKAHHGRIFRYDTPPIVDPVTGRRGNPGQDFRCRCSDQPVLESSEVPA